MTTSGAANSVPVTSSTAAAYGSALASHSSGKRYGRPNTTAAPTTPARSTNVTTSRRPLRRRRLAGLRARGSSTASGLTGGTGQRGLIDLADGRQDDRCGHRRHCRGAGVARRRRRGQGCGRVRLIGERRREAEDRRVVGLHGRRLADRREHELGVRSDRRADRRAVVARTERTHRQRAGRCQIGRHHVERNQVRRIRVGQDRRRRWHRGNRHPAGWVVEDAGSAGGRSVGDDRLPRQRGESARAFVVGRAHEDKIGTDDRDLEAAGVNPPMRSRPGPATRRRSTRPRAWSCRRRCGPRRHRGAGAA